jgi:hypothetical protein
MILLKNIATAEWNRSCADPDTSWGNANPSATPVRFVRAHQSLVGIKPTAKDPIPEE